MRSFELLKLCLYFQREGHKLKELKTQIQFLYGRERNAREELEEFKKYKDSSKYSFETKIQDLRKDRMKMQDEFQRVNLTIYMYVV